MGHFHGFVLLLKMTGAKTTRKMSCVFMPYLRRWQPKTLLPEGLQFYDHSRCSVITAMRVYSKYVLSFRVDYFLTDKNAWLGLFTPSSYKHPFVTHSLHILDCQGQFKSLILCSHEIHMERGRLSHGWKQRSTVSASRILHVSTNIETIRNDDF